MNKYVAPESDVTWYSVGDDPLFQSEGGPIDTPEDDIVGYNP